ncbi:carbohydrate ABC transporter permease [Halocatena marina]|uniref:carbohydrate ABC transporter permease n=1 Tax=Halocatena marina TaxID=2934937 RepID=UPI0020109D9F|nr:carbohydrate ABC transporter permease [Halocatena marina]
MPRSNYEYPGYEKSGTRYYVRAFLLYTILVVGAVWMLMPFWFTITTALTKNPTAATMDIFPSEVTLVNFQDVIRKVPVGKWFFNSLLLATTATLFNLVFDSLAGYALGKLDFWGNGKLFLAFISTMMVPGIVTLIPVYIMLTKLGWVNTYQGLLAPFVASPLGIFLLRQQYKKLPSSLGDAARMDGCSEFQVFYKIYLPMTKPSLAALGIFTFIGTWNNFEWPLIIANDSSLYTLPVALFEVRAQFSANWGLVMAAAALIVIPTIVVFLLAQKQFIKGMTLSGTKG